ncbi:MAG TPA: sn-glycerol-3-phosphate ABC transporter ATP-binding protein UgpC [Candidatus Kapabacteria bacterium]|nr:sn-glycerol-3-phosphate ABC transporter ATP-binding protein UgpC [Candidatus Kapabacteria bacterium]
MAEVTLRDVEKRYDNDTFAVKGINFSANDGEFVVLVGPSGCGKSTTLRMVAGLEEITGGEIEIGGTRVNEKEPKDRDVAMVFQNYELYPHMTVFDNMAFPLKMRKVPKDDIRKQVESAAELLSISHHLDRKPKELSGGERQRVAVGRAIVRKPKVFLFDEPLSNLDAALRTQMRAELKRLQRRLGATMLYVTHDQIEAMTMGDRIVVMNKGLVEQFGTPSEVYNSPASVFVARFLGTPPMNIIEGEVKDGRFTSGGFSIAAPNSVSGKTYFGIRPEAVMESGEGASAGATIEGKAILVEPIGSVTHVYIDVPQASGGTFVASIPHEAGDAVTQNFKLGDNIKFSIPERSVHYFDGATGKRIS